MEKTIIPNSHTMLVETNSLSAFHMRRGLMIYPEDFGTSILHETFDLPFEDQTFRDVRYFQLLGQKPNGLYWFARGTYALPADQERINECRCDSCLLIKIGLPIYPFLKLSGKITREMIIAKEQDNTYGTNPFLAEEELNE